MAKQTKIIIAPQDVALVRLQCAGCKAEVALDPRKNTRIPDRCPACYAGWGLTMLRPDLVGDLLNAFGQVLTNELGPVSILFEVDDSD